jgi:hypothetical protein
MKQKIKIVVINENCLGYILPEIPNKVQILHASILKGGNYYDGVSTMINKSVRLAKKEDFDIYRVQYQQYKSNPNEYEFG